MYTAREARIDAGVTIDYSDIWDVIKTAAKNGRTYVEYPLKWNVSGIPAATQVRAWKQLENDLSNAGFRINEIKKSELEYYPQIIEIRWW